MISSLENKYLVKSPLITGDLSNFSIRSINLSCLKIMYLRTFF